MKKLYFSILIIALINTKSFAQGYSILNNSNYSPANSVYFNPAKIADSKHKFQINLVSLNGYLANDYGTVKSLSELINQVESGNYIGDVFDIQNDGKDKNFDFLADIRLPSFVASINKNQSFSFNNRVRTLFNAKDISSQLMDVILNGLDDIDNSSLTTINNASFNVQANAFGESALSYGLVLLDKEKHVLKGGLTAKYLYGAGAVKGYNNKSNIQLVEKDVLGNKYNTIITSDLDVNIATSNSKLFSDNSDISFDDFLNSTGRGFGGDIGLEYEWRPNFDKYTYEMDGKINTDYSVPRYKLKLGAALTDVGSITYKSGRNISLIYPDSYEWDQGDLENADLEDIEQTLIDVYGPNSVKSTSKYKSTLPTAVNLNADYNFNNRFYLAANFMQGVTKASKMVNPYGTLVSVAPRFETKNFEATLPLTYVSRYSKVNVGLGLRAGFFFIGSDDLGGILGISDLSSANVYAGISFSIGKKRLKDKDGDKVSNKLDQCPKVFGLFENKGCPFPDTDKDGIFDKDDACPTEAGTAANKGCPDKDGDSVIDKEDKCPDIAGPVVNKGCPYQDRDGDGILDKDDVCPDQAGLALFKGCPDRDGDNIQDKDDACPDQAGPPVTKGCPDKDGDGVADKDDRCPEEVGPVSNNGCPVKQEVVTLTKIEERIIFKAVSNLQFQTGKAIIKPYSFPSLKDLAKLMKERNELTLSLSGHTDNVGKPASNLVLSQKRADAVKAYLVKAGVNADKISTAGYGQTKPIASNKTPAGRAKNRRVEFKVE
ncbi:MAG: DUF5723 family protein [Daejeonella sp.]